MMKPQSIPRNAFRVFTDERGRKHLVYIDANGSVLPLVPKPEEKRLTDGYYTPDFKLIRATQRPQ